MAVITVAIMVETLAVIREGTLEAIQEGTAEGVEAEVVIDFRFDCRIPYLKFHSSILGL